MTCFLCNVTKCKCNLVGHQIYKIVMYKTFLMYKTCVLLTKSPKDDESDREAVQKEVGENV